MATMLSYILTDASVSKSNLDSIFKDSINKTLNALTIDGDTSTNDTAIILSPINNKQLSSSEDLAIFKEGILTVLAKLSYMLVDDGEGATKVISIDVINANFNSTVIQGVLRQAQHKFILSKVESSGKCIAILSFFILTFIKINNFLNNQLPGNTTMSFFIAGKHFNL